MEATRRRKGGSVASRRDVHVLRKRFQRKTELIIIISFLNKTSQSWMASTVMRSCALHTSRRSQNRLLSSSSVLREQTPAHVGVAPSPRKPVGGIRGG